MKQKDIATLVLIAGIAAFVSFAASRVIFKGAFEKVMVPVVDPLSSDFPQVKGDPNYSAIFYDGALDPTQLIQIGNTQNNQPFTGQ